MGWPHSKWFCPNDLRRDSDFRPSGSTTSIVADFREFKAHRGRSTILLIRGDEPLCGEHRGREGDMRMGRLQCCKMLRRRNYKTARDDAEELENENARGLVGENKLSFIWSVFTYKQN